jgi:hypothetical protein
MMIHKARYTNCNSMLYCLLVLDAQHIFYVAVQGPDRSRPISYINILSHVQPQRAELSSSSPNGDDFAVNNRENSI